MLPTGVKVPVNETRCHCLQEANLSYQELQHRYQRTNFERVLKRLIRVERLNLLQNEAVDLSSVSLPWSVPSMPHSSCIQPSSFVAFRQTVVTFVTLVTGSESFLLHSSKLCNPRSYCLRATLDVPVCCNCHLKIHGILGFFLIIGLHWAR